MPRLPELPSRNLRLRRRRFPKNRPRGAPSGYLEGVGWLATQLLWIDGWLTGPCACEHVDVCLDLEGIELRVRAPVLVDREIAYPAVPGSRRWILAVPVEGTSETVSCVRDVSLSLSCGEVLWHGGRERLIAPDVAHRLRVLDKRPDLLSRADALLSKLAEDRGDEIVEDPVFKRNSRTLRSTWARSNGPRPKPSSRFSVHVEHAASSRGGSLMISGWMAADAPEDSTLSVLTRSGERLSLRDRAIFYSRPDLELNSLEFPNPARAFLAVVSLGGSPAEATPVLCVDDPEDGAALTPLKPELVPASEITRFVESQVEEAFVHVDDETAYRLLAAISAELCVPSMFQDPVPFGCRPLEPRLTVITSFLDSHDLLDFHFAHTSHADRRSREYLLLFGPEADRSGILDRLEGLAELYDIAGMAFFSRREASWGAQMAAAARRARGEVLVFCSGQVLSFEPGGMERLVRTLLHRPTVGIAAPVVCSFDGEARSALIHTDDDHSPRLPPVGAIDPGAPPIEGSPEQCAPDCFAVRRSLFVDLCGFSGRYFHAELEVVDLCRRALVRRRSIAVVPMTVTRLGADAGDFQPRARSPLSLRHDRERLRRLAPRASEDEQAEESHEHSSNAVDGLGEPDRPRPAGRTASKATPLASVVIPTYNAGAEFNEVLERIRGQEVSGRFEILVVDSGSTDGTLEMLRHREVPHLDLTRGEFGHGSTRQLGADRSTGEIVVFLSQDALPEPGWLEALLEAFEDPSVAGAYSQQIPRNDAPPFVLDQLSRWPATDSEPRLQRITSPKDFEELPLEKKLETLCFDNVSSAVRRSVLSKIPFRNVRFGADRDWAYRVLTAAHAIAYCPDSKVIHSHDRSVWYELKRTFCDHRALRQLIGGQELPTALDTLSRYRHEVLRLLDIACRADTWTSRFQQRLEVPAVAFARTAGESLGTRAAVGCADGSRFWTFLSRVLQRGV